MRKFAKSFFCFRIVSARGFKGATEMTKEKTSMPLANLGYPFIPRLAPRNAYESTGIVNVPSTILIVLRVSAWAQILFSVIERISVTMIDFFGTVDKKFVHVLRFAARIKTFRRRIPPRLPIPLREPLKVLGVYNGILFSREWNQAVRLVKRLRNWMALDAVASTLFRHWSSFKGPLFSAAIILLSLFAAPAFSQNVRVDNVTFSSVQGFPFLPGATITICTAAATGLPCSPTVAGTCLSISDVTCNQSATITSDAFGNYGFWIQPGSYTYTVTKAGFGGFGPRALTLACQPTATCTMTAPQTINSNLTVSGTQTNTGLQKLGPWTPAITGSPIGNVQTNLNETGSLGNTGTIFPSNYSPASLLDLSNSATNFKAAMEMDTLLKEPPNYALSSCSRTSGVSTCNTQVATGWTANTEIQISGNATFNGPAFLVSVNGTQFTFNDSRANSGAVNGGTVQTSRSVEGIWVSSYLPQDNFSDVTSGMHCVNTGYGSCASLFHVTASRPPGFLQAWDNSQVPTPSATISSISRSNNVVTITCSATCGFVAGQNLTVSGVTDPSFNADIVACQSDSGTSMTYNQIGNNASSSGGTVVTNAAQGGTALELGADHGNVILAQSFDDTADSTLYNDAMFIIALGGTGANQRGIHILPSTTNSPPNAAQRAILVTNQSTSRTLFSVNMLTGQVVGGVPTGAVINTNYTVQAGDSFIQVNASSSNVTITLTPANLNTGQVLSFKRIDTPGTANTVTITASSGNIDGFTSITLQGVSNSVTMVFDGTNFQRNGAGGGNVPYTTLPQTWTGTQTNMSLTTPTLTGLTNGTGLQAFNTATSCTTATTINTPCTTASITLPVGYADTNYRLGCSGLTRTNFPQIIDYAKSNTTFTITLNNLTAAAATYASFDCWAVHN